MKPVRTGVTITRDHDGTTRLVAVICEHDMQKLRLDSFDRAVIDSEVEEPADFLQSAEIIFRRMWQQGILKPGDGYGG